MALSVNAGGVFRASQFNALIPLTVSRPSDLAVIVTTLADDAFLFFTGLPANATYRLDGLILCKGSPTGDFAMKFTCSGTGATLQWGQGAFNSSGSVDDHGGLTLASTAIVGTLSATTLQQAAPVFGNLFTGTGSNIRFGLQWAEAALDNVNASSINAGSYINLIRIA